MAAVGLQPGTSDPRAAGPACRMGCHPQMELSQDPCLLDQGAGLVALLPSPGEEFKRHVALKNCSIPWPPSKNKDLDEVSPKNIPLVGVPTVAQ